MTDYAPIESIFRKREVRAADFVKPAWPCSDLQQLGYNIDVERNKREWTGHENRNLDRHKTIIYMKK